MPYKPQPFRVDQRGINIIREDLLQANENFTILDNIIHNQLIPTDQGLQNQINQINNTIQTQLIPTDQGLQSQINQINNTIQTQLIPTDQSLQSQINQINNTIQTQLIPTDQSLQSQINNINLLIQNAINLSTLSSPIEFSVGQAGYVIIPSTGTYTLNISLPTSSTQIFEYKVITFSETIQAANYNIWLYLYPNNIVYPNQFTLISFLHQPNSTNNLWYSHQASGFELCGLFPTTTAIGHINTKSRFTSYLSGHCLPPFTNSVDFKQLFLFTFWRDYNTPWTTLGTLQLTSQSPFNYTLLFYIKRIF